MSMASKQDVLNMLKTEGASSVTIQCDASNSEVLTSNYTLATWRDCVPKIRAFRAENDRMQLIRMAWWAADCIRFQMGMQFICRTCQLQSTHVDQFNIVGSRCETFMEDIRPAPLEVVDIRVASFIPGLCACVSFIVFCIGFMKLRHGSLLTADSATIPANAERLLPACLRSPPHTRAL
eukprot:gnl/TRDRNA2_/TRDRNA2_87612_c0_seq2.p1 gnl/TRDRNA2_/TRDRNA2_87612_c0~~gnl/TRDRNA2_/TRDRNA2_87612_c0_seq2.p1  ORF type:complete len:179 (+),score=15.68 gnl/TRDRNA2_/TRDRNA2_87612_c0_seq2:581-1117(+)